MLRHGRRESGSALGATPATPDVGGEQVSTSNVVPAAKPVQSEQKMSDP